MDYVIIVAGGKGLRMGGETPKQFLCIGGKPILMRTIERFRAYSDELNIIWKLRRALSGLDDQAALETLLARMRKTQNNHEFLLSVLKTTPAQDG